MSKTYDGRQFENINLVVSESAIPTHPILIFSQTANRIIGLLENIMDRCHHIML